MLNVIKNHWFVGVLAFSVSLIIFLPTILSIKKAGLGFQGIYPMFNNDEDYYLSLGREVYDGHNNIGNAFIKEYKDKPSLQQSFAEIIFANEARLLRFSIPKTYALNDFLLPFLGFILLYILFFDITRSKTISGFFSFSLFFIFLSYLNRPTNPQFGLPFFLLGILLVWRLISNEYDFKKIVYLNILLGAIFGALIYIYPFYWTSIAVLYSTSSLILFFRQKNYWYWLKNWLIFVAMSLLIAFPYFFNLLKSLRDPFFAEASLRQGMIFNHWPAAFFNVALMILCLVLIFLVHKNIKRARSLIFIYSLGISGIILNWQNIITGKGLQFSSHYYFPTILFAFLIIAVCVELLFNYIKVGSKIDFRKSVSILLMIILFGMMVYKQAPDIKGAYLNVVYPPDILNLQNLMLVANWLNQNTPKDSAVYALGKNYDWLIPVYTHNNIYWQTNAGMYLMSDEELENRWVIQHFFDGIKEVDISGNRYIWINKFLDTYLNAEVRRKIAQFIIGKKFPETVLMEREYIDRVIASYIKFKQGGFEKALKTYGVDYIIIDSNDAEYENLVGQFENYAFLERLATVDGAVIFKIR